MEQDLARPGVATGIGGLAPMGGEEGCTAAAQVPMVLVLARMAAGAYV